MSASKRPPPLLYITLGILTVLTIIYLFTPSPAPPSPLRKTAEERLRLWTDFVSPDKVDMSVPTQVEAPDTPAIGLDPFPLGHDIGATHPEDLFEYNAALQRAASAPELDPFAPFMHTEPSPIPSPSANLFDQLNLLDDDKELLLTDLPQPNTNLSDFVEYAPHNYNPDASSSHPQKTFATYLYTSSPSLYSPSFLSALLLIYRILWSPKSHSEHHPLTIFVSPTTTTLQRSVLSGAGALVIELALLPWKPNTPLRRHAHAQLSKVHLWSQTSFSRIAFLSPDAHPLRNIDAIFANAEEPGLQRCVESDLAWADAQHASDMCAYTFAVGRGAPDAGASQDMLLVDPGVMVLSPNAHMHKRLVRATGRVDRFDNERPDRGLLMWMFAGDGPFPGRFLDRRWDWTGGGSEEEESGEMSVVHIAGLWAEEGAVERPEWVKGLWRRGWDDMVRFWDSKEFVKARERDGLAKG